MIYLNIPVLFQRHAKLHDFEKTSKISKQIVYATWKFAQFRQLQSLKDKFQLCKGDQP